MKQNWTNNPTKKQVVLFSIAWFVTLIFIILVLTNLLTESFSFNKHPALCFLFIIGSFGMIRVCINYYNK
jgi:hypothetical protein